MVSLNPVRPRLECQECNRRSGQALSGREVRLVGCRCRQSCRFVTVREPIPKGKEGDGISNKRRPPKGRESPLVIACRLSFRLHRALLGAADLLTDCLDSGAMLPD